METYRLIYFTGIVALVSWIIQLIYYLHYFSKVGQKTRQRSKSDLPFVSVIICARNEAENLKNHLPAVCLQDYPDYEVIVVNDASTDDSEEVLKSLKKKHPRLRSTTIKKDEKFSHGKKLAVLVGVKAAQGDILLFTDADCVPASDQWIRKMAGKFTKKTDFVLGYGAFTPIKGVLNSLIRFDTFFIAIQYLGFALAGKPYMGVGRNLAYRKDVFFRNKAFGGTIYLQSGDDDLIVNAQAHGGNTRVVTDADAKTLSIPPPTFWAWFQMKRRHITTSAYYTKSSLWRVGGEMVSRLLFFASVIGSFFLVPENFISGYYILATLIILRWITMFTVFRQAARRLQESQLLLSSFIYDTLSPLIYLLIWLSNRISSKPVQWK